MVNEKDYEKTWKRLWGKTMRNEIINKAITLKKMI